MQLAKRSKQDEENMVPSMFAEEANSDDSDDDSFDSCDDKEKPANDEKNPFQEFEAIVSSLDESLQSK